MAQAPVAATVTASAGNAASATLTHPSATAGDVTVLVLAIGSTTPTIPDPAGFIQLRAQLDASTVLRTRTWYRVCDGSESGSISLSWTGGSTSYAAAAIAYRGVDTTSPIDSSGGVAATGAGTLKSSSSVTQLKNCMSIRLYCDSQATAAQTAAAPGSGYQQRAAAAATAAQFTSVFATDSGAALGPGANGATSLTLGTSSSATVAYNINLTPKAGSPASIDPVAYRAQYVKTSNQPPLVGQLWPRGAGR